MEAHDSQRVTGMLYVLCAVFCSRCAVARVSSHLSTGGDSMLAVGLLICVVCVSTGFAGTGEKDVSIFRRYR